MTTDLAPPLATRPATPAQLAWLTKEVRSWQADGLLYDTQAEQILHRYHAARRFSLAKLLLTVGGCFSGIGLIWLVAANLDQLPPSARFGAVVLLWLAALVGGELLA